MIKKSCMALFICFILTNFITTILIAEVIEEQHMTPNAVVSAITRGKISPEREFIGTVYFDEVSDVSVELGGKVDSIQFDEGQQIQSSHPPKYRIFLPRGITMENSSNSTKTPHRKTFYIYYYWPDLEGSQKVNFLWLVKDPLLILGHKW